MFSEIKEKIDSLSKDISDGFEGIGYSFVRRVVESVFKEHTFGSDQSVKSMLYGMTKSYYDFFKAVLDGKEVDMEKMRKAALDLHWAIDVIYSTLGAMNDQG